jgi:hypothetical protein
MRVQNDNSTTELKLMATQLTAQIPDRPHKKQVAIDHEVVKKIAHVAV